MKGMIFLAFEDFVVTNWGQDTFDDILDGTELATTDPSETPFSVRRETYLLL